MWIVDELERRQVRDDLWVYMTLIVLIRLVREIYRKDKQKKRRKKRGKNNLNINQKRERTPPPLVKYSSLGIGSWVL